MPRSRSLLRCLLSLLLIFLIAASLRAADDYQPAPETKPSEGIPTGEVLHFTLDHSAIFPGTTRDYWVYIPKQYDPAKPACVYISQDGIQNSAPAVFDHLIANGETPILIGVFVTPGRVPALTPDALDRYNRSYEYDGLGDAYARFLLGELLPEVEKKSASDGRPIHLSQSGNDRCIGGSSSGAIAAFTAAWERPDAFSRVFSSIGTFVDLRGGNVYPSLIRKFEPKPLRIFLQDGSEDQNIYGGDWWMANQELERSLTFAGYEVQHVWGDGGHNGKHAAAIFPDAMRFLWKGWPQPVVAGQSKNTMLSEILIPGEEWTVVGDACGDSTTDVAAKPVGSSEPHPLPCDVQGITSDAHGTLYFNDGTSSKTWQLAQNGKPVLFIPESHRAYGIAVGPDEKLWAVSDISPAFDVTTLTAEAALDDAQGLRSHIYSYYPDGGPSMTYNPFGSAPVPADKAFSGNDMVVSANGDFYVLDCGASAERPANLWLVSKRFEQHRQLLLDATLSFANGIALSPDQSLLYVCDTHSHWVYSYQIQPDGSLAHRQRYIHLAAADEGDETLSQNTDCRNHLRTDRAGRIYVSTRLGIQVCDQAGRVNCIIPTPGKTPAQITFAGKDFNQLYAAVDGKIYYRKVKAIGALPFLPPVKPAPPRL